MASRRRRLFRIAIGGLALAVAPVVARRAPASALAQESPAPPETEAARAARKAKALAANDDGVHLAEKGELEPALARLAEALALDPDEPTVRGNAAKVHALVARKRVDERRFVEAAKEYRAAAGLVPGEVEYAHLEGVALALGDDDKGAVSVFERVLEKHADRVPTLISLGEALYRLGRNKDAIARWERALALAPEGESSAAVRAILAKAGREESVESQLTEDLGAPHFTIKFDGQGDPALGRLVGRFLEDAYRDVGYDLGRYPRGEIAVVVYPARAFRAVTGAHGWVAALYDGKIRVPAEGIATAAPAEVKRVLSHEYTHALIRSVAGGSVPAWLHEGIAQLEEGRTRADARAVLEGKELPTLADITGSFADDADPGRTRLRYAAAFDLIAWLAERRGRRVIAEVLDHLGKGEKLDEALKSVAGATATELFDEWRRAR